jgi:rhodanese-related sulfurtransferase
LTLPKRKMTVGVVLVAVLLVAFVLVPTVVAEGQTSFQNVAVDEAYNMTTSGNFPDLVVLDVRYQYEYDMGHLYDAVLIPYNELETRIGELEGHENHEIIVYCRSGYRSQIASEILSNHGFIKVYNMIGGILAWINAGYPISTTFHHVTVNVVEEEVLLQIEPLLLFQTDCVSCAENQTCDGGFELLNITSTVLEQEENYTLTLVTCEVNGTTYEATIVKTLLWSYNMSTYLANRTASFTSMEITVEDVSMQFYSLSYIVQHVRYNLTLYTTLTPLNSETYNSSFTIMNYAPAGKSEVVSLEFVEFNSSVTLSQHYATLGKVAEEMGKIYLTSWKLPDHWKLAFGYFTMWLETEYFSQLVEKQLQKYDLQILQGSAVLMDGPLGPPLLDGGGGGGGSTPPSICTFECLGSVFTGCFGSLDELAKACILGCAMASLACGPGMPVCLGACATACTIIEIGVAIGCAIWALGVCCF